MFCSKCGKEIREGVNFCSGCGAPVKKVAEAPSTGAVQPAGAAQSEGAVQPAGEHNTEGSQIASAPEPMKQKKSRKGLWAVIIRICILLLAGGATAAWYFLGGNDGGNDRTLDRDSRSRREREEDEDKSSDQSEAASVVEESREDASEEADVSSDPDRSGHPYGFEEYREASFSEIQTALEAYQQFIEDNGYMEEWGDGYYGLDLIYLDNDDIPEVVICGMYEAAGNIILTYDGNKVHETFLDRLNFSYMEQNNLLCNSDGHMGYYFDVVYSIVDGVLTEVAGGTNELVYNEQWELVLDENGDELMTYTWNGQEISAEQYAKELEKVYPYGQYPVRNPSYAFFDGAFYRDPFYGNVHEAYYAGIKGLIQSLGWVGVPDAGAGETEIKAYFDSALCYSLFMRSLCYEALFYKRYLDIYKQNYWLSITEQDVEQFLLHSVGTADLDVMFEASPTDPDTMFGYSNYIDDRFLVVGWDTGDYSMSEPMLTAVLGLSDTELQVRGALNAYEMMDRSTILFSLNFERDIDSVWGYRLVGVERWDTYILPYVDSQYLTEEDLLEWSEEHLRYARNEIFARHGRRFDDADLQAYFDGQSWYNGTIAPEDFDDSELNEYEIANRDFIVQYEKEMGYR